MALTIKHKKQTTLPDDPTKDLSADEWNDEHNISGTISDEQHGTRGSELHTDSHVRLHDHSQSEDGSPIALEGIPNLDTAKITTGLMATGRLGTGTPSGTNYLCGDQTWKTPAGGGEAENIVSLTADQANSTTSFADCTGLSFSPVANTDYLIEFFILYTTSATTVGINLAVNGPASPTGMAFQMLGFTAVTTLAPREFNAYNTSGGTLTAAIAGYNIAHIQGILRNGANTGTFILRFAAETTGTVTIKIGSVLRYRQVT